VMEGVGGWEVATGERVREGVMEGVGGGVVATGERVMEGVMVGVAGAEVTGGEGVEVGKGALGVGTPPVTVGALHGEGEGLGRGVSVRLPVGVTGAVVPMAVRVILGDAEGVAGWVVALGVGEWERVRVGERERVRETEGDTVGVAEHFGSCRAWMLMPYLRSSRLLQEPPPFVERQPP
jgi:hypothetical protein